MTEHFRASSRAVLDRAILHRATRFFSLSTRLIDILGHLQENPLKRDSGLLNVSPEPPLLLHDRYLMPHDLIGSRQLLVRPEPRSEGKIFAPCRYGGLPPCNRWHGSQPVVSLTQECLVCSLFSPYNYPLLAFPVAPALCHQVF